MMNHLQAICFLLLGLLTTPAPVTGHKLIDEPAVFGVEVQNEDSFFFWTSDRTSGRTCCIT